MSAQEKLRWKNWAECLRQEMMTGLQSEITKSVESISLETSTTKAESTLRSVRFWEACRVAQSPNEMLAKAGFEIEYVCTRTDENTNSQAQHESHQDLEP